MSALVDGDVSSFLGDYLFPTLIHQDPRYFRWGEGRTRTRFAYALSRVFVRHMDKGGTAIDSALGGSVIATGTLARRPLQRRRGILAGHPVGDPQVVSPPPQR